MKKALLCIVLVSLLLLSGCTDYKRSYEDLQDKYDDLLVKYDNLSGSYEDLSAKYRQLYDHDVHLQAELDAVGSIEDDITTVWCFFESEENVTFSQAHPAYLRIHNIIHSLIYPDD